MTPKKLYNFMIEPDMISAIKRLKKSRPDVSEGQLVPQALREFLEGGRRHELGAGAAGQAASAPHPPISPLEIR